MVYNIDTVSLFYFRNVVFYSVLKIQTMDNVQKKETVSVS
jgi:hypothetical protein